jgi:hypothetical protein
MRRSLTAVFLYLAAASVCEAGQEETGLREAERILRSARVEKIVEECFDTWSFSRPEEVALVVSIDPDGTVSTVAAEQPVSTAALACVRDELRSIEFPCVPGGLEARAVHGQREEEPAGARDPAAGRLIFTQTAFALEAKKVEAMFMDAAIFFLSWGISENVTITFNSVTPWTVWGLGVYPKFTFELAPKVRMGFIVNAGFLWPFADESSFGEKEVNHAVYIMYGGAPLLMTFGSEAHFFNVSVHVDGITLAWRRSDYSGTEWHYDNTLFVVPDIGGSFRIADGVKLNVEVWALLSTSWRWKKQGFNGRTWGISSGARFFGKDFYFDVSAVFIIMSDIEFDPEDYYYPEEVVPYFGPMFSFGFQS